MWMNKTTGIKPIFQLSLGDLDPARISLDFVADSLTHMGEAVRRFHRETGTSPTRISAEQDEQGEITIECRGVRYHHTSYRVGSDGKLANA